MADGIKRKSEASSHRVVEDAKRQRTHHDKHDNGATPDVTPLGGGESARSFNWTVSSSSANVDVDYCLLSLLNSHLLNETERHDLSKLRDRLAPRAANEPDGDRKSVKSKDAGTPTIPQILSPSTIKPWNASDIPKRLPALPSIQSPDLEKAAFTHSGVASIPSAESYERLEWVGDAYLYLISTLLISETFTNYLPGKCAQIRELLVKNETLAHYAKEYRFEDRVKLPPEFCDMDRSGKFQAKSHVKTKVLGDVFEAYVAAIIMDDNAYGIDRACQWLRDLWSRTIAHKIREQESRNTKQQTIGHTKMNPKDVLQKEIGCKGVKITYRDAGPEAKERGSNHPIFTVGVYFDGWGLSDRQLGIGKAKGKKDAGFVAAEAALADEKMVTFLRDRKARYEEELLKNKEAEVASS